VAGEGAQSLPKALKARIDAVEERVNWSAVPAQAFETQLLRLRSQREATNMDELIERMLAGDELDSKANYDERSRTGKDWGQREKGGATANELRALQKLQGSPQNVTQMFESWARWRPNGVAHGLYDAIHLTNTSGGEWTKVEGLWEDVLGENWKGEIANCDFVSGLVDGALATWEEKNQHPFCSGRGSFLTEGFFPETSAFLADSWPGPD
jgi:hypothetical protein